jgi:fumarate hydratase subunit beta
MEHRLLLPLTAEKAAALSSGDQVYVSGVIYTARDAAHRRMMELLDAGKPLPFPIRDAFIYYTGPSPAGPGQVIGSAGPTTSYRMDAYTPRLLALGLRGMIGKGKRSAEVIAAIQKAGALYFGALGGAGALLSRRIKSSELIAFEDLGTEAVRQLEVEDFPLTVVIDSRGNNLYETGRESYLREAGKGGPLFEPPSSHRQNPMPMEGVSISSPPPKNS